MRFWRCGMRTVELKMATAKDAKRRELPSRCLTTKSTKIAKIGTGREKRRQDHRHGPRLQKVGVGCRDV
jgi:hypothetical protein